MIRLPRLLPGVLVGGLLLTTGCPARPPGVLGIRAAEAPAAAEATGSLSLTFALPREGAPRALQFVPIATTRCVRVTVAGPKYRDQTKPGSPKPLMETVGTFDVTLDAQNAATVTLANIRSGRNLTVKVEVYDGPKAGVLPTGKLLETLYGVVDIRDGAGTSASVGWETTPTGRALAVLRQLGEADRVVATDAAALQALVSAIVDDPAPDTNHPVLISGDELANALLRYTRAQAAWPAAKGYAVPPLGHPTLAGVLAGPARAPLTKVFDLRGNEITSNLRLTLGDPISAIDDLAPYSFPVIGPGDWWVFVDGTGPETRKHAFVRRFAEDDADALRACFLGGAATSFAGTGAGGLGTPAAPQFRNPGQIAYDAAGAMFVADAGNHRVVKLDALGQMTVVAGTGTAGASGDGGAATAASLRAPEGVAVDGAGNVFIADTGNHKIRLVKAADGQITTIAGTGTAGLDGDGAALSKRLNGPTNLTLGGLPLSIFLHDSGNKLIRKIPLGGPIAGPYSIATLNVPDLTAAHTGLAYQTVAGVDYLLYCTLSPPRVIRETLTGADLGTKILVAGGGAALPPFDDGVPGDRAQLGQVRALAADALGNVYVGERLTAGYGRVRYVNPARFAELFAVLGGPTAGAFGPGGAPGGATPIGLPGGLALEPGPTGGLMVSTGADHRVVRLAP